MTRITKTISSSQRKALIKSNQSSLRLSRNRIPRHDRNNGETSVSIQRRRRNGTKSRKRRQDHRSWGRKNTGHRNNSNKRRQRKEWSVQQDRRKQDEQQLMVGSACRRKKEANKQDRYCDIYTRDPCERVLIREVLLLPVALLFPPPDHQEDQNLSKKVRGGERE